MTRAWALALAAAAAVPFVQARIDRPGAGGRLSDETLYLWRGDQVKRLFVGFEALAADIYWLRTVQYFGGQRLFAANRDFALLKPLIDITTTLDPRFEIAYRYGAIFLCEPQPAGAGRPEEGIALLEKGVQALPGSWRLRQDLGFFQYIYAQDAVRAAATLTEASSVPGAPFWLETLAADLLGQGGFRDNARVMWKRMYEQAEGGVIKENARVMLQILDAEDQAAQLSSQVQEFARRFGRNPRHLEELRDKGLAEAPLVDPSGAPFEYDGKDGRVTVSPRSTLWRPRKGQVG